MTERPVVVLMPAPQPVERIFAPPTLARLRQRFDVVEPADEAELDAALPQAWALVGQPDLPRERLDRAPGLAAVLNVEGNFYPNIDYPTCFARGVRVLGCGPAYARCIWRRSWPVPRAVRRRGSGRGSRPMAPGWWWADWCSAFRTPP